MCCLPTLEFNLRSYQLRLAEFEKRRGMTSQQFARFNAGELDDNPEWFEWDFMRFMIFWPGVSIPEFG
jgi:hypothetical protein